MSQETMTYGQLTEKLATFGYTLVRKTLEGKPTRIYKHDTIEDAMMFLPDADDREPVPPVMMGKVLLILKTYGLFKEKNPLLT
jgi:hypothetical protein